MEIEAEINACVEETQNWTPSLTLTHQYLCEQFEKSRNICDEWPEAALLSLGRIIEMWLLITLNLRSTPYNKNIVKKARLDGIVTKHEAKFLAKVRSKYNSLKHKTYYSIDSTEVNEYISEFSMKFLPKINAN